MNKCQLEKISYHEAGHAVAYYLSRVRFKYVQIFDKEEDAPLVDLEPKVAKELGHLRVKAGGIVKTLRKKQVFSDRSLIFMTLGGAAAVSIRYKYSPWVSLCIARHEWFAAEPYFHGQTVDFWFNEVRAIMKIHPIWDAVVNLTRELMVHKKIPYKRAFQIIDDSLKGGERDE